MKARLMHLTARLGLIAAVLTLTAGCFGPLAARLADKEVYPILEQKQAEVLGHAREFTIQAEIDPMTQAVLDSAGISDGEYPIEGLNMSLGDALAFATRNSRQYQTRKEQLYLQALDLTAERHEFSPIFSGSISGFAIRDAFLTTDATGGTSIEPVRTGSIGTGLFASRLFATGARLTVGITNSFVRSFGAAPDETASGNLSASIVQPLLRGAGTKITLENLRQAERDVVYEVRSFARFERNFIVDRIEEYFRLLQQWDTVENEQSSYESLRMGRERSEALGEAGRLDVFQVDQARQQELIAENRMTLARTRLIQSLDDFKLRLGLPTELAIVPERGEFDALFAQGLVPVEVSLKVAVARALDERLDLMTAVNTIEDLERRLDIAENSLLPTLDLSASIDIPDEGRNQPLSFDTRRRRTTIGLDLDLPLDRKSERNAYRAALIRRERSVRDHDELRDQIVQQVRSAYQDLEQARFTHQIQQRNLKVANRRVESSQLQLQAGRKQVRDVLESEVDQRDARNALTASLINYTVARLRFLVAIEGLDVDDQGMWNEIPYGENTDAKS